MKLRSSVCSDADYATESSGSIPHLACEFSRNPANWLGGIELLSLSGVITLNDITYKPANTQWPGWGNNWVGSTKYAESYKNFCGAWTLNPVGVKRTSNSTCPFASMDTTTKTKTTKKQLALILNFSTELRCELLWNKSILVNSAAWRCTFSEQCCIMLHFYNGFYQIRILISIKGLFLVKVLNGVSLFYDTSEWMNEWMKEGRKEGMRHIWVFLPPT